jgi:lipopolysaccharide/colanic/teichoic acid biosynthesis glycosyltransferase
MDLIFLPKTTYTNIPFARYRIKSDYIFKKNIVYTYCGFYYIGKNEGNIQKLIKSFKRGSSSDGFVNAKSELLNSLNIENHILPEAIFCDSGFDKAVIKGFRHFLNTNPALSSIPFILAGSGLSEKDLSYYKKNKFLDEIISLNDFNEKNILAKVQFLKKVKSKSNELNVHEVSDKSMSIQTILKRCFDIIISVTGLILLSPLFLLIALAIKAESDGPVFYISKRAGRGYKIFDFYKFRTMFTGSAEKISEFSHLNLYNTNSQGVLFIKLNNDPRITRVGSFLRKTSLDELPQFLNVLLGDMSMVGNRPLPLYEAATLTTDKWAKRFMTTAGITGLWQIKKRGKEDMSTEERISLDLAYADNCNFFYDLWIISKTPSSIIQKIKV